MSNTRQFIDQLASGESASAKETLENSNGTATSPKIDVDVDPSNLILSILKYSNVKQIPQVVSTTPLGPTELPFQINGLFSNIVEMTILLPFVSLTPCVLPQINHLYLSFLPLSLFINFVMLLLRYACVNG